MSVDCPRSCLSHPEPRRPLGKITAGPPSSPSPGPIKNAMRSSWQQKTQSVKLTLFWEHRRLVTHGGTIGTSNEIGEKAGISEVSSKQEKWAVSVTTHLCRSVSGKCRQEQDTSWWFSDLTVFHSTKCDHHLLFTDNLSEYYIVFTACTGWALCRHMYHIGAPISHWLSTCGCHWSRPGPGRGSPGGLDSCTHGASTGGPWSAPASACGPWFLSQAGGGPR